jgi:L-lactate dehydrogenase complex protein LldG
VLRGSDRGRTRGGVDLPPRVHVLDRRRGVYWPGGAHSSVRLAGHDPARAVTHAYPTRSNPSSTGQLWDVFDREAAALGVTVLRAADESAAVEAILKAAPGVVATDSLIERFSDLGLPLFAGGSVREAAPADGAGVAAWAMAETGSLLVCGSNADRGMALLADRLCLVVRAEDIVASLDEALVRAGEFISYGNRYATFMSGPSRTADIERTLTIGVHGPGAMLVIVVGELA